MRSLRRFVLVGLTVVYLVAIPPMYANLIDVQEDKTKFGDVDQRAVEVGPDLNGNNSCAPTATMNAFTYLSNMYPAIYGNRLFDGQASWAAAAWVLAGPDYMKTTSTDGTDEGNWVNGIQGYLEHVAPGTTSYAGMDSVDTIDRPVWDQNANPTIGFLVKELNAFAAIEIGIDPTTAGGIGHVLTLRGLTWDDATNTAILNTIDPANPLESTRLTVTLPATQGNPMELTYNGNPYALTGAMAQGVPEPSTFALLVLGGFGLAISAYRRRQAGA